jgi:hypothetical protein
VYLQHQTRGHYGADIFIKFTEEQQLTSSGSNVCAKGSMT